MAMQLTELSEQLVTIRHNLDPKHGDILNADDLEAARLALRQLSEHAYAFIKGQTDRLVRGILISLCTEMYELVLEQDECLQRMDADLDRLGDHAKTDDTMSKVTRKIFEKPAETNIYLTEWKTLWAQYERFKTELDGAWEQLTCEADQTYNQV